MGGCNGRIHSPERKQSRLCTGLRRSFRICPDPKGEPSHHFQTVWEASAYAYTRRLTDALRTYAKEQPGGAQRALSRKGHAFISYVREDTGAVQQLCHELKGYGAVVWLDRSALVPGARWKQAIRKAIRDGAFFIACFSEAFVAKHRSYMYEELLLAIEELRQRPIDRSWFIPVKLSECEVPELEIGAGATLKDIQFIELYPDWDAAVRKFIDVVAPLPRHLRFLMDQLSAPKSEDRVRAAEALYKSPDHRAMKSLMRALEDQSSPMIAYWAAQALGKLGDPKAVPPLIQAWKTTSGYDYKIAEVLERFDTAEAIRALKDYEQVRDHPYAFVLWARGMSAEEALRKHEEEGRPRERPRPASRKRRKPKTDRKA